MKNKTSVSSKNSRFLQNKDKLERLSDRFYRPEVLEMGGRLQRQFRRNDNHLKKLVVSRSHEGYLYKTVPVSSEGTEIPDNNIQEIANGLYSFVIKQNHPDIVFCALLENRRGYGHSSVSGGAMVLYAGSYAF